MTDLPTKKPVHSLFGPCLDGHHPTCPAHVLPQRHPDPARKGTFYLLAELFCTCPCHTRPLDSP